MKLIFLLILPILNCETVYTICKIYASISKTSYKTIYPDYTSSSNSICVYLDTNEFNSDDKYIEIYTTVYNGRFIRSDIYYDSTNIQPYYNQELSLTKKTGYDYSSYSSSNSYTYNSYHFYEDFTYYFKILKPNNRYLILHVPNSENYFWRSGYRVEIGVSSGLAVWIIIIIVVAAIIIISGIITTIICCRRRRYSYIAPVSGPIAPYSPLVSPYPNVY